MNQTNAVPEAPHKKPSSAAIDQAIDDVPLFKRKRVVVPFFLAAAIVGVAAWFWYGQRFSSIVTDDAFVEADRLAVSAKISGRISALPFSEGDTVRQGDTIVRLDDADIRAQLAKADASVRYLTRSAEISSVNLEKARDDFSRIEKQFNTRIVTQEQYTHAQNALKLAQAQGDMAQSQIATAEADRNIIKIQLGNSVIRAPFMGVIAKRWALTGDVVSPGQAIFSLYDAGHCWVTANYEETKLRALRPGMIADIFLDAYPGMVIKGKIQRIGRATASQFSLLPAANASGNFTKITQRVPITITLDSVARGLVMLPGFSATVHIRAR
jgi:membrane fusion protein, multidrug efflux system